MFHFSRRVRRAAPFRVNYYDQQVKTSHTLWHIFLTALNTLHHNFLDSMASHIRDPEAPLSAGELRIRLCYVLKLGSAQILQGEGAP